MCESFWPWASALGKKTAWKKIILQKAHVHFGFFISILSCRQRNKCVSSQPVSPRSHLWSLALPQGTCKDDSVMRHLFNSVQPFWHSSGWKHGIYWDVVQEAESLTGRQIIYFWDRVPTHSSGRMSSNLWQSSCLSLPCACAGYCPGSRMLQWAFCFASWSKGHKH